MISKLSCSTYIAGIYMAINLTPIIFVSAMVIESALMSKINEPIN